MSQPTISIVVPAYNEERTLPTCLDSLCGQNCSFPYEIIVVDNASTDRTADIAMQAGVRLIHEPRKGVGLARRAGFAAARANIIASTDADCIVPANWLAHIQQVFTERPSFIAIGGYALYHDAPPYLHFLTHITNRLNLFQAVGKIARRQPLSTQNLAVRKSAYEQVGGFDPAITSPLGLDDVDLTLRLSTIGSVSVIPDLVVWASARRFRKEPVKTVGYRWSNYASYALQKRGVFRQKTADVRL
ncbi:MAG: glycosyltransferase [Ardenticatenaceae bacterium]|nr:glycosyltransferase [Anaerolineales bacterium]MCB9009245.1 glycosyltransferase [Ardenticatenaceae bacterium]